MQASRRGLGAQSEGFPITHQIFAGNTQDRATLTTMLDRSRERVGLAEGTTVILDRGMAYEHNLAEIKIRQLNYFVASRQPERERWLADY